MEEVVEGQGFRALDIVLLRRRFAFVAIALPLGLGASAWLGVVLATRSTPRPTSPPRGGLQDDEEELSR